jgi:dihydroxyacid dehydratase/phosphogluconate dehydratase
MAFGGSTNAAIHLLAMAGRAKVELKLEDLDAAAREVPLLANIRPSGKYLMEDFYYAGGIRALMNLLSEILEGEAMTVNGKTLAENFAGAEVYNDDVIRPLDNPLSNQQTLAVLRGNLAPDGAVIKPIAAEEALLQHTGPAIVFEDYNDMAARIDSDDLDVDENSVLILRNSGPLGGPGMPEWGMLPVPKKLLQKGVRDMVRISDARMSGTSYGTCVLHVAPESYIGGPLALVHTGDLVTLDVPNRRLDLDVDDDELARRRAAWTAPEPRYQRGFGAIYAEHVTQADEGCDFRILRDGPTIPEPEIH